MPVRTRLSYWPRSDKGKPSLLESIPPELRSQLLLVLSLEDLKALVLSSSTFYETYLHDQSRFLSHPEVAGWDRRMLTDAYFVYQFRAGQPLIRKDEEYAPECRGIEIEYLEGLYNNGKHRRLPRSEFRNIPETERLPFPRSVEFSTDYSTKFSQASYDASVRVDPTMEQGVKIAHTHARVIKPLGFGFSRWMLDELARRLDIENPHPDLFKLSRIEQGRIHRALYRFEIICRLANHPSAADDDAGSEVWKDNIYQYLTMLEAWEIEQILSVYEYAKTVHGNAFDRCYRDLRRQAAGPPGLPAGSTDASSSSLAVRVEDREGYVEGYALQGIKVLALVIARSKNDQKLVEGLQQHLRWRSSSFGVENEDGMLNHRVLLMEDKRHPTTKENFQQNLRLGYDFTDLFIDDLDTPPVGWLDLWGNKFSSLCGGFVPARVRRRGYVFWDRRRVEGLRNYYRMMTRASSWDQEPDGEGVDVNTFMDGIGGDPRVIYNDAVQPVVWQRRERRRRVPHW